MAKKSNIEYKIKKIGKLMGERSVFKLGVDSKRGRIDLISVHLCGDYQELEAKDESDYIG